MFVLCDVPSEYDATRAYALSKLANVFHTNELARRFKVTNMYNFTTLSIHSSFMEYFI